MPVDLLYPETAIRHSNIIHDELTFSSELYINPSSQPKPIQSSIVQRLGNRLVNGAPCLSITPADVRKNIRNNEYSAVGFTKNTEADDVASGTLQYYDWCGTGKPQLWINDLCRVRTAPERPRVSPTLILLQLFESFARECGLTPIYLIVEAAQTQLPGIYNGYGYTATTDCAIDGYIVMNKDLIQHTMGGRLRHRTAKKMKSKRYTRKRV